MSFCPVYVCNALQQQKCPGVFTAYALAKEPSLMGGNEQNEVSIYLSLAQSEDVFEGHKGVPLNQN